MGLLTCAFLVRLTRLTKPCRRSRSRRSLRWRSRIRFRVGLSVLILMRCGISSRIVGILTRRFFIGRVEEGAGGPRTRPAERYAEGCGARADTPSTRGYETHRGYVIVMLATATEDVDWLCSEGHGGDGRGRDAEAITSRACDVTSLSAFISFWIFLYVP